MAGEWPTYRFDSQNSGYNPDSDGIRDVEHDWTHDIRGTPGLADGEMYLNGSRRDPETGTAQSSVSLELAVQGQPTVTDDYVFVTDVRYLYCLTADAKEVVWESEKVEGIFGGSPTVDGETVFVVHGGGANDYDGTRVRAFDVASGDERWQYDADGRSTPAVADGTVYVSGQDGLHSIDAESGDERFVLPEPLSDWSSPAATADLVYAVTADHDHEKELVAVETADGTVRWRTAVADGLARFGSAPVVAEDFVYATTDEGLVALDRADGTVATRFGSGVPVARAGDVLYATKDGRVYAYDAESGNRLWKHTTDEVRGSDTVSQFVTGLTPGDETVYIQAADGFHRLVSSP
ncbi:PQQ-binding-like beta-propeller repeat protein [Natronosalvus rutilus]|uniref:PQQ-binding-like beta-propeller repeat protein n=1 Tax=Natronosalvus rutilus TaxID=2953753 RepID=A0A9E7SX03_9EURY|nr:PQQ-binding-like beta-propeller repeat protein [Natronosalvus rutilus]UTF55945.1 PQQ-binding-like beta-propeller repeat protein [Natronosalvus rutilus]